MTALEYVDKYEEKIFSEDITKCQMQEAVIEIFRDLCGEGYTFAKDTITISTIDAETNISKIANCIKALNAKWNEIAHIFKKRHSNVHLFIHNGFLTYWRSQMPELDAYLRVKNTASYEEETNKNSKGELS